MVQYIHTPWRDQEDLARVRQQFYPSLAAPPTYNNAKPNKASTVAHIGDENVDGMHAALAHALDAERQQQQAVSRVSMWMQRGGCPHLVESTALLTAAVLSDQHEARTRANSSSYAIRAAYSAAFSRFVTGLLDSQQDKLRKMSMYTIAKTIGLPATFVELRHQATHEQLPSLSKLRSAAHSALTWIWHFYWKDLFPIDKGNPRDVAQPDPRRDLLIVYLREQDETMKTNLQRHFRSWDEASLLRTLAEIGESSEEPQVILRALQLSRSILGGDYESPLPVTSTGARARNMKELEAIRVEVQTLNEELDNTGAGHVDQPTTVSHESSSQSVSWARYQGIWTPKPIGVV